MAQAKQVFNMVLQGGASRELDTVFLNRRPPVDSSGITWACTASVVNVWLIRPGVSSINIAAWAQLASADHDGVA